MEKIFDGVVIMEDSFEKLADICIKNKLGAETVEYLVDIKKALEEREILGKIFNLACIELEDKDSTLFDLYDRLDTYYDTRDRYDWGLYLLESVKEDE